MPPEKSIDPLLQWGLELAIVVLVAALVGAIAIVLAHNGEGSVTGTAAGVVALGAALSYGIIWLRKRRERAHRPSWMGSTTQWRDDEDGAKDS